MKRRLTVFIMLVALAAMAVSASAERTQLTFMFRSEGELHDNLVAHWIEEFEQENPDIEIIWRVASGDWREQMPVWIAAGVAPDVFEIWGIHSKDWAEQGMLYDLTSFVERDFTAEDIDDFFPPSWGAGELTMGPRAGLRFGIPSYGNIIPMYYNKDWFDEMGIAHPNELEEQGDWTWDTFVEVGKKLTRREGLDIVGYALDDDSIMHVTSRGVGWIASAGGQVFDFENDPTHFMLDEPEGIEGLSFMQDLIWTHELVPQQNRLSQYDFRNSGAAMQIRLGTGWLGRMEERVGDSFDWDLGPRPEGPSGSRGYYLATDMIAINSKTPYPEEAWRFLKYLTGKEGMRAHMEHMGRGPARKSLIGEYVEMFPERTTMYHYYGMLDATISPETLMVNVGEARPLIWKAVRGSIATNEKPAAQAIAEVSNSIRALYE